MPATHGSAECESCGAVWGQEHLCPHCAAWSRPVGGGEFRWTCRDCGAIRLPPRVARIVGNDPDGTLLHLHQDYAAWSRKAKSRRRALLITGIVAPIAILALWVGLLTGSDDLGASRVVGAFALAAVALVVAGATFFRIRALGDRAEAAAIDERGEIRRTYRRAVSMLLREEELTDDELAELVQSTRDVRRVRIAAGAASPPRVPATIDEPDATGGHGGAVSEGETQDTRSRARQG